MAEKTIKMLKPGTFRSKSGKVVTLTAADLQATANAYSPDIYLAPMTVGHPKTDTAPSYGKLGAVNFADGFLQGIPDQVAPEFANAVNQGYYDHVSLSLFEPDAPANPKPGIYYPRHLAFLGAAAPAVPGLGTVNLSSSEEGVISLSLDFGDYDDRLIARMFRNMKNFFIGEFGQEKADKVIDEWDLQYLTEEAVKPEMPTAVPTSTLDYSEQQKGGAMALTAEQLTEKENKLNQREAALKLDENSRKHTANLDFAEGLVKGGKLLPTNKAAVVAVLDFAEGVVTGETIEFGEGDGKKTQAPAEIVKALFSAGPKLIEFNEFDFSEEQGTQQAKPIPADIAKFV